MLHTPFIKHLEAICSRIEQKTVRLRAYERVSGGDINDTYRLAMTDRDYFIKVNTADKLNMFEKEADGLKLLSESQSFVVPQVYHTGVFERHAFLLLEYIEALYQTENPKNFAESLVKLHQTTNNQYGLAYDNYIGRLPQKNDFNTNWIDFFVENRLQFQIDLAGDLIPASILHQFERLYQKLPELLWIDRPVLVHGDLWSGNYFYNLQGQAVIFDPAVYYGHREVDLAMMQLFGGFPKEIYELYQALLPMASGWQERLRIYQLYPLLVHVNLFGTSYLSGISRILSYFVKNT